MIGNGRNSLFFEKVHRAFNSGNRRRVDDDVALRIFAQRVDQQIRLRAPIAFVDHVSKIRPMKAGNVFVRIAQLKLIKDVVPHPPGGARRKSGDGPVRKMGAQAAQLAVFGAKFVPPFRDAVRLIDGEECDRNALQPANRIGARQTLGRKIQQPVLAGPRLRA